MRKILQANIKTINEKNHVEFFNKEDIVLDSLVFKKDQKLKDDSTNELMFQMSDNNTGSFFSTTSTTLTSTKDKVLEKIPKKKQKKSSKK